MYDPQVIFKEEATSALAVVHVSFLSCLIWNLECLFLWREAKLAGGCILLSLMINCVIALSKALWNHEPQASNSVVNFDNVMTKFIFNKGTDA